MKRVNVRWFCLIVVCFLPTPFVSANLVLNGSFEEGMAQGSIYAFYAGGTGLTGWDIIGDIESVTSYFWQPSDGYRSLDLNGSKTGGVQQTFTTIPGIMYYVQFDMAGNTGGGPSIKSLQVSAAGQSAMFSFDETGYTPQNMGWTTYDWSFTANEISTTLSFVSQVVGGAGPALDNVSVTPEPATLLLLGLGGLALRKRTK